MNIYPSLMVVDQADLKKEIDMLSPYCAGFHVDVMDNVFVPNNMWNDAQEVNKLVSLLPSTWIHLMIKNPAEFYDTLVLPNGTLVSFHIESNVDAFMFSKIIREKKHRVSLAIRPKTLVSEIVPFLHVVDHILLMSVEPGFPGQHFLEETIERLADLVNYRDQDKVHFKIGLDGGINKENIKKIAQYGADDCAIATAIFKTEDHVMALQELRNLSE